MIIADFRIDEVFSLMDKVQLAAREIEVEHAAVGKLYDVEAGKRDFMYEGAAVYYYPGSHTTLEMGMIGSRDGAASIFSKETGPAKKKMIELLFIPNKDFRYRENPR